MWPSGNASSRRTTRGPGRRLRSPTSSASATGRSIGGSPGGARRGRSPPLRRRGAGGPYYRDPRCHLRRTLLGVQPARAACPADHPDQPVARDAAHGTGHVLKKTARPSEINRPDVHAKRATHVRWARRVNPQRLVFVDEAGANIAMGWSQAWVRRGQELVEPRPTNWGPNLTMIGAIRQDPWGTLSTKWQAALASSPGRGDVVYRAGESLGERVCRIVHREAARRALGPRGLLHVNGSKGLDRTVAAAVQHCAATQRVGLSATGPGSH